MENYIKQAKQGDERAIEKIVSQYKGLVRSYANKFFLVGGDKDDLLQEGMIGLFFAITNYIGRAHVLTPVTYLHLVFRHML